MIRAGSIVPRFSAFFLAAFGAPSVRPTLMSRSISGALRRACRPRETATPQPRPEDRRLSRSPHWSTPPGHEMKDEHLSFTSLWPYGTSYRANLEGRAAKYPQPVRGCPISS